MKRVIVNTTSIAIEDYKKGNYKALKNTLNVWNTYPNGGKYVEFEGYIEDEESNTLYIHRGYNLNSLMKLFPYHKLVYDLASVNFKHMKLNLTKPPRDDLQKESIAYLLGEGKYEKYKDDNQKFLCLGTGEGKTYCAIHFAVRKGLIPMIIVNNNKILQQWIKSCLEFTDIKEEEIFIIRGSNKVRKLIKMKNPPYKFFIASHRTLDSFTSDDLTLMNKLFSKIGVGVKIFDEAHVEWKNIFKIDLYTDVKYNLYLTATPSKSAPAEIKVYNNMFGDIPVFGLDKERKVFKRIVYYNWNSHPSSSDLVRVKSNYGFDLNAYNAYLLEKKNKFFPILKGILDQMLEKDESSKVVIIFNCNDIITEFKDYLIKNDFKKSIGVYTTLIKNLKEREKELEKDVILATVKGFNLGADIKGLNIVINTVSFSSQVIAEQLSGRLRYIPDKKSWFIDFMDKGFPSCTYHRTSRNKFLKTIAKKIYLIDEETSN